MARFDQILDVARQLWSAADDLETLGLERETHRATVLDPWEGPLLKTAVKCAEDETDALALLIHELRAGARFHRMYWIEQVEAYNQQKYTDALHAQERWLSEREATEDEQMSAGGRTVDAFADGFRATTELIGFVEADGPETYVTPPRDVTAPHEPNFFGTESIVGYSRFGERLEPVYYTQVLGQF